MKPKRILFLTADTGFGHRRAAQAVIRALEQAHGPAVECRLVNPILDCPAPGLLRGPQRNYDLTVRWHPRLYYLSYRLLDARPLCRVMELFFTLLLKPVMLALLQETQPDAVLSTYHILNAPTGQALASRHSGTPFFTIITDLARVHTLWFQPSPSHFFAPTPEVSQEAQRHGIPAGRISVTGIPVALEFAQVPSSKEQRRRSWSWIADRLTVLAVGSRRVRGLPEHLRAIDASGLPLQIVAAAGGDEDLYAELQSVPWRLPTQLYRLSDQIPAMMAAADVLISKAGGLIISESLAAGLPLALVDHIPGQESGNIDYICSHQAGRLAPQPAEMVEILAGWLQDGARQLREVSTRARALGKPAAASQVAARIWDSL